MYVISFPISLSNNSLSSSSAIMLFTPLSRFFSKRTNDPELGYLSSLKNKFFKSKNKSLLTSKTIEIENKIVQHLARFATIPNDDVFAFVFFFLALHLYLILL